MPIASIVSLTYTIIYSTLAYTLPAYQTFKAIEKKGSTDVKDWAEYWVVLACFYLLQAPIDFLLCWLPFYYLAKLGFLLALWHPSTRVAAALYQRLLSPLGVTYEADIDRLHHDVRTRTADLINQHTATLKVQARKLSGQVGVQLKNLQQKAMEKAKQRSPALDGAAAGHGLHAE